MEIQNQNTQNYVDTSKALRRSQTFMSLAILKFSFAFIMIAVGAFMAVDKSGSDISGLKVLIGVVAGFLVLVTIITLAAVITNSKLIKATTTNSNYKLMLVGAIICGAIAWIAFYKWYRAVKSGKNKNLSMNNNNVNNNSLVDSTDSNNMPQY